MPGRKLIWEGRCASQQQWQMRSTMVLHFFQNGLSSLCNHDQPQPSWTMLGILHPHSNDNYGRVCDTSPNCRIPVFGKQFRDQKKVHYSNPEGKNCINGEFNQLNRTWSRKQGAASLCWNDVQYIQKNSKPATAFKQSDILRNRRIIAAHCGGLKVVATFYSGKFITPAGDTIWIGHVSPRVNHK